MNYAKDRDKAFIALVMNDDIKPWINVCKKYGLKRPDSSRVEKVGIYKAVQYCTNIPEEIKGKAAVKCLNLGFNPFINPERNKDGQK